MNEGFAADMQNGEIAREVGEMARLQGRDAWVSLPEAAEAVHISLPALRYLVRRLGFALGAAQDDRGDTYLPASRLDDLRHVVASRAQGYTPDQIERRLRAPSPAPAEPPPQEMNRTWELESLASRPASRAAGASFQGEVVTAASGPSLPFPFEPPTRRATSHRGRSAGPARRHELPFPSSDLRHEVEALRQENRELRERLDELVAMLRAQGFGPSPRREEEHPNQDPHPRRAETAPTAGPRPRRVEPQPDVAQGAGVVPSSAEDLPGRTVLTRTPSGAHRPAVVRSWNPPALNGRR